MNEELMRDIRAAIESVLDNGKDYGVEHSQADILALFASESVYLAVEVSGK